MEGEISKTIVALTVVVLAVGFSGLIRAQSVSSPEMGYAIVSTTDIECEGTVSEEASYEWIYGTGDFDAGNMTLNDGQVAQICYSEDLNAIGGQVQFAKTFMVDTNDIPNLSVSRNIGYVAGQSPAGMVNGVEKVIFNIIAIGDQEGSGDLSDMSSPCPWQEQGHGGLTTCESVAAGSSMSATDVSSHTDAGVQTTELPSLEYKVEANGSGEVSAGMSVHFVQGVDNDWSNIISEETYSGHSAVSGEFKFSKSMKFVGKEQ